MPAEGAEKRVLRIRLEEEAHLVEEEEDEALVVRLLLYNH